MKENKLCKTGILLSILIFVLLQGCAMQPSAPTQFYMLQPISGSELKLKFAARDQYTIVAIAPIEFPAYLDRPQFIIRKSHTQYRLAEFDQWAEPLQDNFERVFFENLNILLNDVPIAVVRHESTLKIDYRIRMAVIRMESDEKGFVSLDVGWIILSENGRELSIAKVSSYKIKSKTDDYAEIAATKSIALESLSKEIAEAIKELPLP